MRDNRQIQPEATLLRKAYVSTAVRERREYFLYLPAGYDPESRQPWPLMLFLHGGGERGDGLDDLDYVLRHGPLYEAWIQRRDLPFIIIGPQLPIFDMYDQVRLRAGVPKPEQLVEGRPPRPGDDRPGRPMIRAADTSPSDVGVTADWGPDGAPGGWQLCETDLLTMVDGTLREYQADPKRVYITGLSYGGYGTWHMAAKFPDRWAAAAPICGDADPDLAHHLTNPDLPIWIFHGGRDLRVKPQWIYAMANALEESGHKTVRLTIHEELGHDVWSRVYAGEDLYRWFLDQERKPQRP